MKRWHHDVSKNRSIVAGWDAHGYYFVSGYEFHDPQEARPPRLFSHMDMRYPFRLITPEDVRRVIDIRFGVKLPREYLEMLEKDKRDALA